LEDWKIKVSLLWMFKIVADLVSGILVLLEPDVIDMIRAGELYGEALGPDVLLVLAVMLLVPLVMAFLTLALKGSANRWANIIVGIVFAGLGILNFADPAMHTGHQILVAIALFVAPVLIVWYAWKSKQKP